MILAAGESRKYEEIVCFRGGNCEKNSNQVKKRNCWEKYSAFNICRIIKWEIFLHSSETCQSFHHFHEKKDPISISINSYACTCLAFGAAGG